jgi:hypothetical protein
MRDAAAGVPASTTATSRREVRREFGIELDLLGG